MNKLKYFWLVTLIVVIIDILVFLIPEIGNNFSLEYFLPIMSSVVLCLAIILINKLIINRTKNYEIHLRTIFIYWFICLLVVFLNGYIVVWYTIAIIHFGAILTLILTFTKISFSIK